MSSAPFASGLLPHLYLRRDFAFEAAGAVEAGEVGEAEDEVAHAGVDEGLNRVGNGLGRADNRTVLVLRIQRVSVGDRLGFGEAVANRDDLALPVDQNVLAVSADLLAVVGKHADPTTKLAWLRCGRLPPVGIFLDPAQPAPLP